MRSLMSLPLVRAVRGGIALAMVGAALPALARQVEFELEGGRIEDVLPAFARQAGLQVIAPAGDGTHTMLKALHGRMEPRQALAELLAGSDLSVASDDGTTITLSTRAHAAACPRMLCRWRPSWRASRCGRRQRIPV